MIEAMKLAYADRAQHLGRSRHGQGAGRPGSARRATPRRCATASIPTRGQTRARHQARQSGFVRRRQHHALFRGRSFRDRAIRHIDFQYVIDRDAGVLHRVRLRNGARKTVKQVAIGAIRLLQSILDQADDDVVRYQPPASITFLAAMPSGVPALTGGAACRRSKFAGCYIFL